MFCGPAERRRTVVNRRNIKFFCAVIKRQVKKSFAWVAIAASALAGCRAKPPVALAPPAMAPVASRAAGVRVTLLWSSPVDLDLYVTDPSLETVYFANSRSQTGGRLEQDVTCKGIAGGGGALTERAEWAEASKGRYRVGVDFMEDCGSEIDETEFRVVTEVSGKRRERAAKILKGRFEPVVLEFDVPGESGETAPVPKTNRRGS
jgi:hypothetical protein